MLKIQPGRYKKCALREQKLKLQGKILNQYLFNLNYLDVALLTQLGKELK